MKVHHNIKVTECGFFISSLFPFWGSSPDDLVYCTCCGEGIGEIKIVIMYDCITCIIIIFF